MTLNVEYINELMGKKGWSTHKLAMRAGLSAGTVSRIINGKRGIGARTLEGISKAFPDEPVEKLFILTKMLPMGAKDVEEVV